MKRPGTVSTVRPAPGLTSRGRTAGLVRLAMNPTGATRLKFQQARQPRCVGLLLSTGPQLARVRTRFPC